jgi:hypothetical protein
VFDIIYCASEKYLNFYKDCPMLGVPTKQRVMIAKRNEEIDSINDEILELSAKIQCLRDSFVEVPSLVGREVRHSKYGKGKIISNSDGRIIAEFGSDEKVFNTESIAKKFLLLDDPDLQEAVESNYQTAYEIKSLEGKIKVLQYKLT